MAGWLFYWFGVVFGVLQIRCVVKILSKLMLNYGDVVVLVKLKRVVGVVVTETIPGVGRGVGSLYIGYSTRDSTKFRENCVYWVAIRCRR